MSSINLLHIWRLELEESDYDDTLSAIIYSNISVNSDNGHFRTFEVRSVELADALRALIFKCKMQDGNHSELLWDTGEYIGMRKSSVQNVTIEIPIGTDEVTISCLDVVDLIVALYLQALNGLLTDPKSAAM